MPCGLGSKLWYNRATPSLARGSLLTGGAVRSESEIHEEWVDEMPNWPLSLNTSTIRPASILDKISIAAGAGYSGIELWSNDLTEYEEHGGTLAELRRRLEDASLEAPSIIALFNWMQSEGQEKSAAFSEARRRMEQAASLGARRIVASPHPDSSQVDIGRAAAHYRELLELGEKVGVSPSMEFLGFNKNVYQVEQAVAIAQQAEHPAASIVLDPFHLYRGGSGFGGIRRLRNVKVSICHFNDAPAVPPQFEQSDADRVYPGDGILPLDQMLRDLASTGYEGYLSIELFNRAYWEEDLKEVAKKAREKTTAILSKAGGNAVLSDE
jgi:2-keto-myo-inositol isomerase